MNLEELYHIYLNHPVVTTDSRKIEAGSLFFALKGDNFNGNTFVLTALENGAAYAVADEKEYAVNDRIILVEDVLKTLQDLGRLHRQKLGIPIIAITGTNGKTTTKELVSCVLSKKFRVVYTRGNLNNHIGVPLTLLNLRWDTEIGVIEMGANHPGEIMELCRIALPDFGLITNVGRAHLEGFGSFEGVISTKTEMYRFLEKNKGAIFINQSNQYLTSNAGDILHKVSYTTTKTLPGLEGEVAGSHPHLTVKVLFPKGWLYIKTRLAGTYNLENVLAAAAVGQYFDIDPSEIVCALESYTPENNRSQIIVTGSNTLLMDAYNANPSSMHAALDNFLQLKNGKKGVIIGDMLELGEVAIEEHQKVVDLLATMDLDLVILVGPLYAACTGTESFLHFSQSGQLADFLSADKPEGYHLLIKGSRGMKLEVIIPYL